MSFHFCDSSFAENIFYEVKMCDLKLNLRYQSFKIKMFCKGWTNFKLFKLKFLYLQSQGVYPLALARPGGQGTPSPTQ